jgi:dihydrofolate reductase
MRKLILSVAVTLDGFIEGPHGEYDWCFTDQDYGLSDLLNRVDSQSYSTGLVTLNYNIIYNK